MIVVAVSIFELKCWATHQLWSTQSRAAIPACRKRPQRLRICLKPRFAKVSKISGDPVLLSPAHQTPCRPSLNGYHQLVTILRRLINCGFIISLLRAYASRMKRTRSPAIDHNYT